VEIFSSINKIRIYCRRLTVYSFITPKNVICYSKIILLLIHAFNAFRDVTNEYFSQDA